MTEYNEISFNDTSILFLFFSAQFLLANDFPPFKNPFDETFFNDVPPNYQNLIIKASKTLEIKIQQISNLEKVNKSLETELSQRNKEILELKCNLLERSQEMKFVSQRNSRDFAKINENMEDDLKLIKKKYKKAKIRLKEQKERIEAMRIENDEKKAKIEEKERQIGELRRDMREIMKENLSKKANVDQKESFSYEIREKDLVISQKIKEIQEKNKQIHEKEDLLLETQRLLDEKTHEINTLLEKNQENIVEMANLKKRSVRFEELKRLEEMIEGLDEIPQENCQEIPKIYYKFLEAFNKCIDTEQTFTKLKKIINFLENLEKEAEKSHSFSNYQCFLENIKSFIRSSDTIENILANSNKTSQLIEYYHINLETLQAEIKRNSKDFINKVDVLSSIIRKQEFLINDLISKNQDLRNKYSKQLANKEKYEEIQEKCRNYEKKMNNYREIFEKKALEIVEIERKYSELKRKSQEFEMLYNSQKIEYEKYRENILSKKNKGFFQKNKSFDLPLARTNEEIQRKKQKNKAWEIIFRYLIAKSKGFNFKFNKYLKIVPKAMQESNYQENMLLFEEFSNFIGTFFKDFAKIYDDINEIENNVDALYLENYNLKVLLLQSFKKILGSLMKKKENCNDLHGFYTDIKNYKISYVDSFDEIPVENDQEGEERCLDFEVFQNLQVQFQKINGLIVKCIEET